MDMTNPDPQIDNAKSINAYASLLTEVKERIRSAQYNALKTVNKELVSLYWDIGKSIVERQEIEGWGKSVVQQLSADLQAEFPGIRGFSVQNLWYMRQFYLEYHDEPKLQPLVGEISWTKNLVIMARLKPFRLAGIDFRLLVPRPFLLRR